MKKFYIAVLNRNDINGMCWMSTIRLAVEAMVCGLAPIPVSGQYTYIDFGRNNVLDLLKKNEWDYCLMVDSDISIANDHSFNIVERWTNSGHDIITGIYVNRHPPHLPHLFEATEHETYIPIVNWDGDDFFPVDGAGGGFLFFTKKAIDKIGDVKPFKFQNYYTDHPMGEDLSFFKVARAAGLTPVADPKVILAHHGVIPLHVADFRVEEHEVPAELADSFRLGKQ